MSKYIKKFESETEYNLFLNGVDFITPNISWCVEENTINYHPYIPLPHDYSLDYLTIVSTSDNNTIEWKATNASLTKTISVSTDDGQTWTDKTSDTNGVTLAVLNIGDKLLIKGNNSNYGAVISYGYEGNKFVSTSTFDVEGNIMSLIYGGDFYNKITLSDSRNFIRLFDESKVVNAKNLILPATTLTSECYANMFKNCTNLITTPNLPATLLQYSCYIGMFRGCTSLITAPVLPATTLASNCYSGMFENCSSLTTAPVLPVTTLAGNCYGSMFRGCTSLITAPVLPATIVADSCYQYMFYGCVSLTTAPDLPANQLEDACYYCMFSGCTNLNYIKCLATKKRTGAIMCTSNWVTNVASLGTFVKSATMAGWSWSRDDHGIPSDWTVVEV